MVNIVDCGRYEFKEKTALKKVFAFGAGKQLERFVEKNPDISLAGVIDNYRSVKDKELTIREKIIKIVSIEQFIQDYRQDSVVIITCQYYVDIIKQLDSIEQLQGIECYIDQFLQEYTEHFKEYPISKRKKNLIPKKIHFCWFGGNELPEEYKKYIESWKKNCPDYEIIRWDESNYDVTKNQYMKQAYENKQWAFVSDYARIDVVYQHGGIYMDTDVEVLKPLDDFLKWQMFCGFENSTTVNLGIMYGAVRGSVILKDILNEYENRNFVLEDGRYDLTACPVLHTSIMKKYGFHMNGEPQIIGETALYSKEFFAPFSHLKGFGRITENTHSIHHYAASWVGNDIKDSFKSWLSLVEMIKNRENRAFGELSDNGKISRKNKFQIWDCVPASNMAAGKAPTDIRAIAERKGFYTINIHPFVMGVGGKYKEWSVNQNKLDWEKCFDLISQNSILLCQHPFWQKQEKRIETILKLKSQKNVKVISLVHDVEKLRGTYLNEEMIQEFNFMLKCADVLIVHNNKMKHFFIEQGISQDRIVNLEIFDYLASNEIFDREYNNSVVIAGNLDSSKSGYIKDLCKLNSIKVHLFGPNYCLSSKAENVVYHGAFPMEQIVGALKGSFGLVWDGDSIEYCQANTGEYLKYNNPHKLSLYLTAGLPIIIWKKAAMAEFVLEQGVGIVVDSLYELLDVLPQMSEEEYKKYSSAAQKIGKQLQEGKYTLKALEKAEKIIEEIKKE